MQVRDCMNTHLICITPEESVAVAARLMARHNIGVLPVRARDGSLCGIVTDRDLVLRCTALERPATETSVARVMTGRVASVSPMTSVVQAADKMAREQVRRLPVEDRGKLCGMLTLGDLANSPKFTMEAAGALGQICTGISNR